MEKGYYIFAYVEINKYANFYKTDTKRHDQNISLWEYDGGKLSLLRYWETDRNCHFGFFAVSGQNSVFPPNYDCF
ncbi:hypothetical protein, partial [Enterobacter hormaechei]